MNDMDVSVIIPAYNESGIIGNLVNDIKELYPNFEIIVVNDGSTDATAMVSAEAGAIVYSHPYNIGNGAAIKSGIRIASGAYLVFMDADGQHSAKDISKLLDLLPEYDMVVGARHDESQASVIRAFGNKIYNWIASYVANFKVEDLTSGFRAIKADLVRQFLYLLPNTYSYPTTLTLCVLRSGRSIKYVDIKFNNRKTGKSKINIINDGIKFFVIIIKICTLYSPLKIFIPLSAAIFMLGVSYYVYTLLYYNRFTNMAAMLITTSILIFMIGLISEQIAQMRYEQSED